eukprot:5612041-Alexandrium_andersonii.AAC.1
MNMCVRARTSSTTAWPITRKHYTCLCVTVCVSACVCVFVRAVLNNLGPMRLSRVGEQTLDPTHSKASGHETQRGDRLSRRPTRSKAAGILELTRG